MMRLEPNDLMIFARVVDAGGFARAADRLGIPKSTVSRRVTALESALGERLLQRTTRRIVLTDFGQRLLEHSRIVAEESEHAAALADSSRGKVTGRLRVSMPGDLAGAISAVIAQFIADYPLVQLELDLSPRRVDLIAEGYDLAVRTGGLADDAYLVVRKIAELGAGLYASPRYLSLVGKIKHPNDLSRCMGLHLALRNNEAAPWHLRSTRSEDWRGTLERRALANAYNVLTELAIGGAGVSMIPDPFARTFVDRGALAAVLPQWRAIATPVFCVFPSRSFVPAKVRAFADALVSALSGEERGQKRIIKG